MVNEILALNQIRLEKNLTYRDLGAALDMSPRAVHRILTTPNAGVFDRTLYKIRQFLAQHDRPERGRARRASSAA